jgi:hypothetical protein
MESEISRLFRWKEVDPKNWECDGATIKLADDGKFYAVVSVRFWPTKGFPTLNSAKAWAYARYVADVNVFAKAIENGD